LKKGKKNQGDVEDDFGRRNLKREKEILCCGRTPERGRSKCKTRRNYNTQPRRPERGFKKRGRLEWASVSEDSSRKIQKEGRSLGERKEHR